MLIDGELVGMLLGYLDALGPLLGKRDGLLETDGKSLGIMLVVICVANTDVCTLC